MIPTSFLILVVCLIHVNYAKDKFENFDADKLDKFIDLTDTNTSQAFKRFKSFVNTIKGSNNDVVKKMKRLSKLISNKKLKKKLEKSDKMLKRIESDTEKLLESVSKSTAKTDLAIGWIGTINANPPPELSPVDERLKEAKEHLEKLKNGLDAFKSDLSSLSGLNQEELDKKVKPTVNLLKGKDFVDSTKKALRSINTVIKNNKK